MYCTTYGRGGSNAERGCGQLRRALPSACSLLSRAPLGLACGALAAEKFTAQRHVVTHDGRAVYEWDQTLEEVNAYVPAPPGVRACHVECAFSSVSLRLGLAGNPPYMQVSLRHAAGDHTQRAHAPARRALCRTLSRRRSASGRLVRSLLAVQVRRLSCRRGARGRVHTHHAAKDGAGASSWLLALQCSCNA